MKKERKAPKGNKAYQQGYVSFSPEDLKQEAQQGGENADAYDLLDQAMTTSSHVSEKDKQGGVVDIDDVYPVTLEETEEMSRLLDEAEKAAGNPNDPVFNDRLNELRGIVAWSKKRHWNFKWIIIAGVLLTVYFLANRLEKKERGAAAAEKRVELVEAWTEMDTTLVLENLKDVNTTDLYNNKLKNANLYKAYIVEYKGSRNYYSYLKSAEEYRGYADTATTKSNKNKYLKAAKERDKNAAESLKKFEELNSMKFKEVKKMALKETGKREKDAKSAARKVWFWNTFFLLCIPLYIFADRPYGYMESRYRTEAKVLGGIRKWGFRLAGFLAGSALGMEYASDYTVKTRWSDGSTSTHTETDPTNYIIIALKIGLYIAALFVICVVSCFIMVYSTVTGLIRNYDWTPVKNTVNSWFSKTKENK